MPSITDSEQRWPLGSQRWPASMQRWPGTQQWPPGAQRWRSNVSHQDDLAPGQEAAPQATSGQGAPPQTNEELFTYKGPLSQAVKNLKVCITLLTKYLHPAGTQQTNAGATSMDSSCQEWAARSVCLSQWQGSRPPPPGSFLQRPVSTRRERKYI